MPGGKFALAMLLSMMMCGFAASGQTPESAVALVPHFQMGAEFSGFDTDVATSPHPFEYGIGAYADWNGWRGIGIEAEARTIHFNEIRNVRQDVVSGGLRYIFQYGRLAYGRLAPFAKVLGGLGSADFPAKTEFSKPSQSHDTFTVYTLGAGADYRMSGKLSVRGDFEYQTWLNYGHGSKRPGFGTANPRGFSVGAAYRFF